MAGHTVEKIEELVNFTTAEGPHWDHETQSLYFVDMGKNTIHKYVPSLKKHTFLTVDKSPSFIIPISGTYNRFIISLDREIAVLTWDGTSSVPTDIKTIITVEPHIESNRLNDGKADLLGNIWTGTMAILSDLPIGPITGSLYSIGTDKKVKVQDTNIAISNGLTWSKDMKKMYYIDSAKRRIDEYDLDISTMSLSNCRPLFTFEKHQVQGYPDGQTIDEEGNLWVAVFQGPGVLKISTEKPEILLDTVKIPDYQVTSVAFGGPNLDELFVTSANLHFNDNSINGKYFVKGYIYKVTGLGVKGLPGNSAKILDI